MNSEDLRAKQRATWKAAAQGWVAEREAVGGPAEFFTTRLVEAAGVREGHSVVDFACGSGDPALTIARLVGEHGHVVGLDLVAEMIEGARAAAEQLGIRNAEFRIIEDEREPGLDAHAFDAATCRFGLMFMPDPVAALRAWRDALKPGAAIAVSTWEAFPIMDLVLEVVGKHADVPPQDPGAPGVLAIRARERLRDLLLAAGYRDVAVENHRIPLFAELEPVAWWDLVARTAGPVVALLGSQPEETRSAIRIEGIRALERRHPSGVVREFGDALLASALA